MFSTHLDLLAYRKEFQYLTEEAYAGLIAGGETVIIPKLTSFAEDHSKVIPKGVNITILSGTPSAMQALFEDDLTPKGIHTVWVGGEACAPGVVKSCLKAGAQVICNYYGPTETTIDATGDIISLEPLPRAIQWDPASTCEFEVRPSICTIDDDGSYIVPDIGIGVPVMNMRNYILTPDLVEVPPDCVGELYISGVQVTWGYLNRPALTAEKFIANPFVYEFLPPGASEGDRAQARRLFGRMYKSGDLVRLSSADKKIYFIGRSDRQVKVRGYRIELGDIEEVLAAAPGVTGRIVLLREDSLQTVSSNGIDENVRVMRPKYLAAYVTPSTVSLTDIKQYLSERLPPYSVPSVMIALHAFPVTSNDKVDARELPIPKTSDFASETAEGDAFDTATENIIAEVMGAILKASPSQMNKATNFFESGGDSLSAIRLVSQLGLRLNLDIPIGIAFRCTSIAALGDALDKISGHVETDEDGLRNVQVQRVMHPISVVDRTETKIAEGIFGSTAQCSFAQERLWFIEQFSGGSEYTIPEVYILTGELDINRFEVSIAYLIARHEPLRTIYRKTALGTAEQVIINPKSIKLEDIFSHQDLTAFEDAEDRAREYALKDQRRAFDLLSGPVIRVAILKVSPNRYWWVMNTHHIATDGWSGGILHRELRSIYNSELASVPRTCFDAEVAVSGGGVLPELSVQYADFSAWQREYFSTSGVAQLQWWVRELADVKDTKMKLPLDSSRPVNPNFRMGVYDFDLSDEIIEGLRATICKDAGCTLFVALLAAFNILLHIYSRQETILIGVPVAGRRHNAVDAIVGLFVNTIVVRCDFDEVQGNGLDVPKAPQTKLDIIRQVAARFSAAQDHQDVPFEKIVSELKPERHANQNPIIQVLFNSADTTESDTVPFNKDLTVEEEKLENNNPSAFDLSATVYMQKSKVSIGFDYMAELFTLPTIKTFAQHYTNLLRSLALDNGAQTAISSNQPLINSSECNRLLVQLNETRDDESRTDVCLHEKFVEYAECHPDTLAACHEDTQWTYGTLLKEAKSLCAHILQLSNRWTEVGSRTIFIGLYMSKTLQLIRALYGVLFTGFAFVPLDPSWPADRVKFVLKDCKAVACITTGAFEQALQPASAELGFDIIVADTLGSENEEVEIVRGRPDACCYCLYTSGTTGTPKGTLAFHKSVVNISHQLAINCLKKEPQVYLFASNVCFDSFVDEVFTPHYHGSCIVLVPKLTCLADREFVLPENPPITVVVGTPSALQAVYDSGRVPPKATIALIGGEAVSLNNVKSMMSIPTFNLFGNGYGPTEITVECCYEWYYQNSDYTFGLEGKYSHYSIKLPPPGMNGDRGCGIPEPTLGRPSINYRVYVLNDSLQIQPVGVVGELHIAGRGVCWGYLNKPQLTSEKFIANPFVLANLNDEELLDPTIVKREIQEYGRMYKSGDLCRWSADGRLSILGRADRQVKLRGLRIEIGEVERVLGSCTGVGQCCVLVRSEVKGDMGESISRGQFLCAYVTPKDLRIDDVKAEMGRQVPAYFIPAAFVCLDILPETTNQKVDMKALPLPTVESFSTDDPDSEAQAVPLDTPIQKTVAQCLSETLAIPLVKIGKLTNFFTAGGDSLTAIRFVSSLSSALKLDVPLGLIFRTKNISELAAFFEGQLPDVGSGGDDVMEIKAAQRIPFALPNSTIPGSASVCSFAQERMWFFAQLYPEGTDYNMPEVYILNGQVSIERLAKALKSLVVRHESLRTVYAKNKLAGEVGGESVQVVISPTELDWGKVISIIKLDQNSEDLKREYLRTTAEKDMQYVFDLAHGPVFKAALASVSDNETWMLLNTHHIASDGWSSSIMERELGLLYSADVTAESEELAKSGFNGLLPKLNIQYADFASWQRDYFAAKGALQLQWWLGELEDVKENKNQLPTDRVRPTKPNYTVRSVTSELESGIIPMIQQNVCNEVGCTVFVALLAAFEVVIHTYSKQQSIVLGCPVAGRRTTEVQDLVGVFVNTLPIRCDFEELEGQLGLVYDEDLAHTSRHPRNRCCPRFPQTVGDIILQTRDRIAAAHDHQDVPFEKLIAELRPERRENVNPLVQVLFNCDNTPGESSSMFAEGVHLTSLDLENQGTSTFDLTVTVNTSKDGKLIVDFEYMTELWDEETVRLICNSYLYCLTLIAKKSPFTISLDPATLTTDEERTYLLSLNKTSWPIPEIEAVHDLVMENVTNHPHDPAIICKEVVWTWEEMETRTKDFGRYLMTFKQEVLDGIDGSCLLGSGRDSFTFMGLMMERTEWLVASVYSILYTGCGFIPLDPTWPVDRARFVVEDSCLRVIVTQDSLKAHLEEVVAGLPVRIVTLEERLRTTHRSIDSFPAVKSSDACYVIYTSGTTGKPKGVVVPHRGIPNISESTNFHWSRNQTIFSSNICFDAFVDELFGPHLHGSTVVIIPKMISLADTSQPCYPDWVKPKFMDGTPGAFQALADSGTLPKSVECLWIGGEVLTQGCLQTLLSTSHLRHVVNAYGPTECTVECTGEGYGWSPGDGRKWERSARPADYKMKFHGVPALNIGTFTAQEAERITIPTSTIGRPWGNMRVYVLSTKLELVPRGVVGVLYISGVGVTLGYLKRPSLTAEKFIANPFAFNGCTTDHEYAIAKREHMRLYNTGDLCRWTPDGRLAILGRSDRQVKLRGFRLELGEIEQIIGQYVSSCHVIIRKEIEDDFGKLESRAPFLCAYVTPTSANIEEIRQGLQKQVPSYFIPSAWVKLPFMPMTQNDKIDSKKLPIPKYNSFIDSVNDESSNEVGSPLDTASEKLVGEAIGKILNLKPDQMGRTASFFSMGGDSLSAIRLAGSLSTLFNAEVPLSLVFKASSIIELAASIELLGSADTHMNESGPPLTSGRQRTLIQIKANGEKGFAATSSFAQQRMWFLDQLFPNGTEYNMPEAYIIKGKYFSIERLRRAVMGIVTRHEALRTMYMKVENYSYHEIADETLQVIVPTDLVDWGEVFRVIDIESLCRGPSTAPDKASRRRELISSYALHEFSTPFNLSTGPVIRMQVARIHAEEHWMILNTHHIASDGFSSAIFHKELRQLYDGIDLDIPEEIITDVVKAQSGFDGVLPPVVLQYADFAVWQKEHFRTYGEGMLRWWVDELQDVKNQKLQIPTDRSRPSHPTYVSKEQEYTIPSDLVEKLRSTVCKSSGCTLFVAMLTAFHALLGFQSRQETVLVGCPVSGRPKTELQELIGLFVNTMVIRCDFEELGGNLAREFDESRVNHSNIRQRCCPKNPTTLGDLLLQVRDRFSMANDRQDLPFEKLVGELKPERRDNQNAIVQVLFNMDNALSGDTEKDMLGACEISEAVLNGQDGFLTFDIAVTAHLNTDNTIQVEFEYMAEIFDDSTIRHMMSQYINILRAMTTDIWNIRLDHVSVVEDEERHLTAVVWNNTEEASFCDRTVHDLLTSAAALYPNRIAVKDLVEEWTYSQLVSYSTRIATHLIGSHNEVEQRISGLGGKTVALFFKRGVKLLAAVYGALYAGMAFVPLDIDWPADRIQYVLEDSGANSILTHETLFEKLKSLLLYQDVSMPKRSRGDGSPYKSEAPSRTTNQKFTFTDGYEKKNEDVATQIIVVDDIWLQKAGECKLPAVTSLHAAYVLYTSGTTGKPKGVIVPHIGLCNVAYHAGYKTCAGEFHICLFSSSICFDAFVDEVFTPLSFGWEVVIVDRLTDLAVPERIPQGRDVTLINGTPTAMQALIKSDKFPSSVRVIFCGAEAMSHGVLKELFAAKGTARVLNFYGPTETTVESTSEIFGYTPPPFTTVNWKPSFQQVTKSAVPVPSIGVPLPNTKVYIVNTSLQLLPVGITGEMCIAGAGVTWGYINQPGLTAEKYIANPFALEGVPSGDEKAVKRALKMYGRLYRTGDLCRWTPSGRLAISGRADRQIKLRGFRIELGEVEQAIYSCSEGGEVANCCVAIRDDLIVSEDGMPMVIKRPPTLVAYITPENVDINGIHAALMKSIPSYMVPQAFVKLPELPRTQNDKVDAKKLGPPNLTDFPSGAHQPTAPRTYLEEQLADIYSSVLGHKVDDVFADFFSLGGNSLTLVSVSSLACQKGMHVTIAELNKYTCIADLAQFLTIRPEDTAIVKLASASSGSSEKIIFLIHPAGGNIYCFKNLAKSLAFTVYGLQMTHMNRDTLEDMASEYIIAMKTVQARGPYIVVGYSFGAVVAFEIAQQLTSSGEICEKLILLDSGPTVAQGWDNDDDSRIGGAQEFFEYFMEEDEEVLQKWLDELDDSLSVQEKLDKLEERLPSDTHRVKYKSVIETYVHCSRLGAEYSYRYTKYSGRVIVICSADDEEDDLREGKGFDKAFDLNHTTIEITPGDHLTMVDDEEKAAHVASLITKYSLE